MSRLRPALLGVIVVSCLLGACGIKPGQLEPPSGAESDTFPRTYPSPETDSVSY